MIEVAGLTKRDIRFHYDLSSPFYRLLWGPHIHHGLWESHESASEAQRNLTDRLAQLAQVAVGATVLDVGCGLGGSSVRLAQQHACHVTGITLSGVQRIWAACGARWHGVSQRTRFLRADAEQLEFPSGSFDLVWSVECTEHLFHKRDFFARAATWLKPGGRLAICAWLEGPQTASVAGRQLVENVCEGFLCPSLGSFDDYAGWITSAGMELEHQLDWTTRVAETWAICLRRVTQSRVRWLARLIDCIATPAVAARRRATSRAVELRSQPTN